MALIRNSDLPRAGRLWWCTCLHWLTGGVTVWQAGVMPSATDRAAIDLAAQRLSRQFSNLDTHQLPPVV